MLKSVNQFVGIVRTLSKDKRELRAKEKALNELFFMWVKLLNKGFADKEAFMKLRILTDNWFLWENELLNHKGNSFKIKSILESLGYEVKIMFKNDYFSTQVFLVFASSGDFLKEGLSKIVDYNAQELRKGA